MDLDFSLIMIALPVINHLNRVVLMDTSWMLFLHPGIMIMVALKLRVQSQVIFIVVIQFKNGR